LAPKAWFTAAELAEMALPGLPSTKRGVQNLSDRDLWASRTSAEGQALSRKRIGRGGGLEYHASLLPEAARAKIILAPRDAIAERPDRESMWLKFDRLPASVRAKAEARLAVLQQVEDLMRAGLQKGRAIDQVVALAAAQAKARGEESGFGASTVHAWFALVLGVSPDDRAAYLAPAYAGRTRTADLPMEAWELYKGDYLRQSKPTFEACHRRLERLAADKGWTLPSAKTLQRRLEAEIPPPLQTVLREGPRAGAHSYPHLRRDRSGLSPMQVGNLDGHTWDVIVEWEDGTTGRPLSVATQDIASSMPLAIRFDRTLNANLVRLALADTFRDHGLFETLLMDNGRENAAASIAGGQTTLRRWHKTPEQTPDGVLKLLGIKAVFVTPYWGQAKPVERMFRDWAHEIAKLPDFEGAYVGHNTVSKPENQGARAIPIAQFEAVIRRELAFYNAQRGRRGAHLNGRSFAEAFAEGIARKPPRQVTPEQLRLCLLSSKPVSMHRQSGAVEVEGHRYWSPALGNLKRQRVVLRFDPEAMQAPVYVYSLDGRLVAEASRIEAGDFDSFTKARGQRAAVRDYNRATKAQANAVRRLRPSDIAAQQAQAPLPPVPVNDPVVVRPCFTVPRSAEQLGQSNSLEAWERGFARTQGGG